MRFTAGPAGVNRTPHVERVTMIEPNQNSEQREAQPGSMNTSRRRLIKAGAIAIPTLITLHAKPTFANHSANHKKTRGNATQYPK